MESNVTMIGTARHRLPTWLVTGLALGLFLARVIAEATRVPWSPLALAALVVAACATLVWLARWLDRRGGTRSRCALRSSFSSMSSGRNAIGALPSS